MSKPSWRILAVELMWPTIKKDSYATKRVGFLQGFLIKDQLSGTRKIATFENFLSYLVSTDSSMAATSS